MIPNPTNATRMRTSPSFYPEKNVFGLEMTARFRSSNPGKGWWVSLNSDRLGDLARSDTGDARGISRPVGESAGVRDGSSTKGIQTDPSKGSANVKIPSHRHHPQDRI